MREMGDRMWDYAQMTYEAGLEGGPEAYLARIQNASHSIGFAEGLEEGRWQGGALGVAIGVVVGFAGFLSAYSLHKRHAKKEEAELAREVELKDAIAKARYELEFGAKKKEGEEDEEESPE